MMLFFGFAGKKYIGGKVMEYTVNDIVGFTEEREELIRLCEIFNNQEEYVSRGAKLPKGVIFYGEPGNGKTLFAKVMASICDFQTVNIDLGNVVDEMSVCKNIKKVFNRARKSKYCTMIIFDEIDKVLPNQSAQYNSTVSKTILAQLLTHIDGLDSAENVIFVATCNNYHNLPPSLVRSGRIDKKIYLSSPNFDSRVKLIRFYQGKTSCTFELKPEEIAKLVVGFSCASIASFINECVLRSDGNGYINKNMIYNTVLEIKNEDIPRATSSAQDELFACRNIGAFVVSKNFNDGKYVLSLDADTVCNEFFNKIISEYNNNYSGECGDYDEEDYDDDNEESDEEDYDDDEDDDNSENVYYCKEDLVNTICVLFGGYIAEELILNKVFDNVGAQLEIINDILINMLYHGMFGIHYHYSESRRRELDYSYEQIEIFNIIYAQVWNDCYERAKEIVLENEKFIRDLISVLIEKRNIDNVVGDVIIEDLGGIKKLNSYSNFNWIQ